MNDQSTTAEQYLAGALLIDSRSYFKICGVVGPMDFYNSICRKTFQAVAHLLTKNDSVDLIAVSDYLDGDVQIGELSAMANSCYSTANIVSYAKVVKQAAKKRHARLALGNALQALEEGDVDDVVTSCMSSLQAVGTSAESEKTFAQVIDGAIAQAETAVKNRTSGAMLGVSTTIPMMDHWTGGLHGGRLIVLGGRPGTFKSAFAWQILVRAAQRKIPVGMISLEMEGAELGQRAIANVLKVPGHAYANGVAKVVSDANARIPDHMRDWPLWLDDSSTGIGAILARITEWKYRYDIKLACVDYLQLIGGTKKRRYEEIGEISRALKLLTLRLNMPILLLAQLGRDVDRERREPRLSDLRESGNIEQDADTIMFTHKPRDDEEFYELLLAKQRGGVARKAVELKVIGEHFFVGEADKYAGYGTAV